MPSPRSTGSESRSRPSRQLELFETSGQGAPAVDRAGWLPPAVRPPRRDDAAPAGVAETILPKDPADPKPLAAKAELPRETDEVSPESALELDSLEASMSARAVRFAIDFQLGSLADRVHVAWNRRMRTAAGRAHYRECRIELNPRLAELPNAVEEIERTFLHELAHLVAHHRYRGRKIRAHGPEWRQACVDLGIPGEGVYHQLPFEGRKVRRQYAYRCPACGSEFERVRRFRQAVACYDCCSRHTGGRYDDRYRLIQRKL